VATTTLVNLVGGYDMRYNQIKEYDVANGEGVRISLWTQGCSTRCPNCFNKDTWDFNCGHEFTKETIEHVKSLLKDRTFVKRDLSILGGEPLEVVNIPMLTMLLREVKKEIADVSVWLWTSKSFEDVREMEMFKYIDVLIDGKFEQELYSPRLNFRGSSNQRIIKIQESLQENKIVLHELNNIV